MTKGPLEAIRLTGDAHDRLLWFHQEGESLAETLDRVMSIFPGPQTFRDAGVAPERLDERPFLLEHLKNTDGIFEPHVYRGPGEVHDKVERTAEAYRQGDDRVFYSEENNSDSAAFSESAEGA